MQQSIEKGSSSENRLSALPERLRLARTVRPRIKMSDRVFLAGRTGSGKTTLVRQLLSEAPESRWVVLDPKHDYHPHDRSVPIVPEFHPELLHQVVRVPVSDDEMDGWDSAINGAWVRGNGILYVDETTLITPARALRPSLGRAIRTGRSRGLGVWCASQRPKDIPSAVFTESEHFCIFQLNYEADREKVLAFTDERLEVALSKVRGHDYVYYNVLSERSWHVHQGAMKR